MKYEVEINFHFNFGIKHISPILMGLHLLAENKEISLKWRESSIKHRCPAALKIVSREVGSGKQAVIVFDMHDHSNLFYDEMLKTCDVYYKRSFYLKDVKENKPEYQHLIRPYGMNLPTTSPVLTRNILKRSLFQVAKCAPRNPVFVYNQIKAYANFYLQFVGLPNPNEYTQSPKESVSPTIFFQTRIWTQDEVGNDSAQVINDTRAGLIRVLKKHFKDQFVGGLLPTEFAKQNYPDCITTHQTDTKSYIRLLKNNLIGVYTRGLNHSVALKLPEYVAASLCIVSENIRNELPGSFSAGKNYLEFEDIDTCVSHCDELLKNRELAQYMREENFKYYVENLDPKNKMLHCLEDAYSLVANK